MARCAGAGFNANILSAQEVHNLKFNLAEVANGVRVSKSGSVQNSFRAILHRQNIDLGATAEAALAVNTSYELALRQHQSDGGVGVGAADPVAGRPLQQRTPFGGGYAKVMVFLTDGQNTRNRWTSNPNNIDARTRPACDAIKSKGISSSTL